MVEGYAKPTGQMVPPFDKARIEETPLCFFAILEEPALWRLFVTRHLNLLKKQWKENQYKVKRKDDSIQFGTTWYKTQVHHGGVHLTFPSLRFQEKMCLRM